MTFTWHQALQSLIQFLGAFAAELLSNATATGTFPTPFFVYVSVLIALGAAFGIYAGSKLQLPDNVKGT